MRLRTEGMDWRGILSPGLGLGLCPVPGKDKTGAGRGVGGTSHSCCFCSEAAGSEGGGRGWGGKRGKSRPALRSLAFHPTACSQHGSLTETLKCSVR